MVIQETRGHTRPTAGVGSVASLGETGPRSQVAYPPRRLWGCRGWGGCYFTIYQLLNCY